MAFLTKFPLFVLLAMAGAVAMLVPSVHAAQLGQWPIARAFLYHSLLFLFITSLAGMAMMNRTPRISARAHLLTLLLCYLLLPAMLAMPVINLVPSLSFGQGYFEMLANLTTTGSTVFSSPAPKPPSLHLWNALVGWMGGFLILMAALAILEPMNLGGFEIRSVVLRSGSGTARRTGASQEASLRIIRVSRRLIVPYVVLTGVLALILIVSGDRPFVAIVHAMAVLSTNGTSPVGGFASGEANIAGEIAIFAFLFFAVSHRLFRLEPGSGKIKKITSDPEIRLAVGIVVLVPLVLFLRHWFAAFEVAEQEDFMAALKALWGGVFTVMSFLTTLGFESAYWDNAQSWSGIGTPGLIFLGLAMLGGGVATTAGGVKLLRVNALYMHGIREMHRLVHPSSIAGSGTSARRFRREGAQLAWVFLMLFLLGFAVIMLLLSATGLTFEASLGLAIASLANTGPAVSMLGLEGADYTTLSDAARYILGGAMILGRMEALAVIALFNPDYWR